MADGGEDYDPYRDPDSGWYDPYRDPDSGMYDPYLDPDADWNPDPEPEPEPEAEPVVVDRERGDCFVEQVDEGCIQICFETVTYSDGSVEFHIHIDMDYPCPLYN